jgi:hypothetical protein
VGLTSQQNGQQLWFLAWASRLPGAILLLLQWLYDQSLIPQPSCTLSHVNFIYISEFVLHLYAFFLVSNARIAFHKNRN